ncbi:alpha/beta fold hydrolase [Amycolatopsis kentuckyensis]|uniref:alpha/beta fold hydrolase n=1 Tax=Amycolatopsis kentuckyensis TaxID=218823 RepID=UPI001ABFB6BE
MTTSRGTVKTGEVEIAYAESGAGEPVILLHGGESTHIQYDEFRPLLTAPRSSGGSGTSERTSSAPRSAASSPCRSRCRYPVSSDR